MLKSRKELDAELGGAARAWLDEALAEAAHDAATPDLPGPYTSPPWELRYAAAGRHCGPEHADSVRSLLLVEARAPLSSVTRLYEQGTAAERRAVLLTLHRLDLGDTALPLVEDALRANDTRLVAAAVGPYAADHLDPHAWRHAVLKCLFTEVPVAAVARLDDRARGDAELARMLSDFAEERTAAGRAVPEDLRTVLGHVRRIRAGSTTPGTSPSSRLRSSRGGPIPRGVAETPESLRDEGVPAPCDAPHQTPRPIRP